MSTRRKAVVFGVFSKSKIFRPHKFLSFSLAALFKKKQTPSTSFPPAPPNVSSPVKFINAFSIEEEEEEKKRKKKLQISSLAVSYSIHTHIKNAQKRRSKTERRELHE